MSDNQIDNDEFGFEVDESPPEGETLDEMPPVVDGKTIVSAVDLELMLDKKEYEEFKRIIASSTTLEDTDDLSVIVKNSISPAGRKTLNKILINFICCLATESFDSTTMNTFDQMIKLATSFEMWKDCIHLKSEFANGVLRCFKNKVLPDFFHIDFPSPTANYIKKNKLQNKSPEEQMFYRMGEEIKTRSDLCKREINSLANPLWINPDKFPSGVSVYQYLHFLRQQLWPSKAWKLALYSVKSELKKNQPDKNFSRAEMNDVILERCQNNYPFDADWYPDWWLVFIFLGFPSGPDHVRPGLMSGNLNNNKTSFEKIRDKSTKVVKNGIDNVLSTPTEVKSVEKRQKLDLTIHYDYDSIKTISRIEIRQKKLPI